MSFDPSTTNPYAAASTPPATPKKSNTLLYVLGGIAAFVIIGCCGCGGLMMYGGNAALQMAANQVKPQLAADPVIQQHIGNLQTAEISLQAYIAEAGKNARHQQAGRDIGIKVKGDKGSGLVVCKIDQSNPGQPRVVNAELVMPSGEAFPLSQ
jgi:hypothetical protein